jgi:dipeptidyl aminopeptidase/acylaminoacyl peptidase
MTKKRSITAEDFYKFEIINGCEISPDGKNIAFAVQRVDEKTEKKYSNIWLVPTGRGKAKQFTYGDQSDSQPKWSPDGSQIAFVSNRADEKQPQIYIIPVDGGEARKLTDLKGQIGGFEWSPDGKKLVMQFRKKDKEAIEREEDEQKKKLGVVYRKYDRVFFKQDGAGFLPKERWHIWTVDAKNGKTEQLTDHEIYDEYAPKWSPDETEILFISNHAEDPDLEPEKADFFIIPAEGGEARKIETPVGSKGNASFSPDGKWIAYFGKVGRGKWWKQIRVWLVPTDGRQDARCLTEDYDFNVSAWTINDMNGIPTMPATWSKDGDKIYFQVAHHGNTHLKSVTVDDEPKVEDVIDDKGVVGAFTFDEKQEKLAYFHADMDNFGQIWVRDMSSGKSKTLTKFNEKIMKKIDLGAVEEFWFKGADDNDLQGWIIKPPNFDENKQYPSVLEIHGGPRVQYGNLFMHEFYYLAAQGYVVYFCNPRGGQGYGEEHSKSIWNDWGTVDYEDLMAFADLMEQKPYIDKEKMGVTGGSYGGYMTNWIIGNTHRFSAAVTQRSVSNLISMWGSSDGNWIFEMEFGEKPPWESDDTLMNFWRQSPMKHIKNAKTPTLVIHSEQDLRCAMEQGEQVFVALKKLGVDTEFVRFPDEPHGLSRGGRTDRRIARLEHISGWFDKYLKDEEPEEETEEKEVEGD